jgi:tetratricopeptide (TPR) repeat protein
MIVSTTLAGPGAEQTLGDALRSAAPLVDGFLVIFSGCDPVATERVVREVTTGKALCIAHLDWPGDYGKARNFALQEAESLGKLWSLPGNPVWAMTLDCDERLQIDPSELSALDMPEFDVICVHDRDLLYQKPRFIRCGVGARWYGIVHERLTAPGQQGSIPECFWELPKNALSEEKRWQRGLVAVPKMLAEKECPSLRRHYAECLLSAGRDDEAREQFAQVLEAPGTPLYEQTWCQYRLAEFAAVAGRYEVARGIAAKALAKDPGFIQELGWVMAHCAAKLREFQTAALWADYALRAPIDYSRGGHRGSTWRRGCEELLSRIQEAAERQGKPVAFGPEHFAARREYAEEYRELARALIQTVSFSSHLDLGAGNGLLIEAMTLEQVVSCGIEASTEAEAQTTESIAARIRYGLGVESWAPGEMTCDLVSCVEVLEHLPESQATDAVAAICARSNRYVYFSAAQPGQGGIGHINEQPESHWIGKFLGQGMSLDTEATETLRKKLQPLERCWWLARNALIFRRID